MEKLTGIDGKKDIRKLNPDICQYRKTKKRSSKRDYEIVTYDGRKSSPSCVHLAMKKVFPGGRDELCSMPLKSGVG